VPHIAKRVLEAAGVGGWELDIASGHMTWTATTFRIFDVDPPNAPTLSAALALYAPETRAVVAASVHAAIDDGMPWDIENPLITARGGHRWVRSWGLAVREASRTVRLVGAFQDVTDRHELNARTERLTVVADQMTNIVISTDRSGRIDWANSALTRLTGYTLAEAKGCKPGNLLQGPRTDPATIRTMGRGVADGTGFDVEILNYGKGGVAYWVAIVCSPLRDAGSAVTGFISVQTDITSRRAAEDKARIETAERRRAEALLRDVLDALPSAITAYDSADRLIMSNRRYREMFPISARFAVPGRSHAEIVGLAAEHGQFADAPTEPAARDAWVARHRRHFHEGTTHELRLPNGRVAEIQESRSQTGNRITVRTDVTDLRRAEALLRDVVNAVPSAIMAYDHDERMILTNPAVGDRVSLPPAFSTMGERLEDMMRLGVAHGYFLDAPAAPAEHEAWLAQFLAYLRDPDGAPRVMRLADGRTVQVSARRSESGNLVIVRTDITELVRAHVLLQDVMDALPNAVVAFDRDERLVVSNRANEVMSGGRSAFSVLGARLRDLVRIAGETEYLADAPTAPAERAVWLDHLLAYLRDPGGEPQTMRLTTDRFVQVSARRSEAGNLVIVRTDTTELLTAQAMLRDVLDAIPDSVAAFDAEDRLVLSNPAYMAMFPAWAEIAEPGRRYEDVVRFAVGHGLYPQAGETPEAREAWIAIQLAHHRTPGDVRTLHLADGRVMLARERRSDRGTLVSVRTDITDQTRAEALLRDVVETLPSAVMVYDCDERLVLWNGAAANMLPLSGAFAAVGRTLEEMLRFSAGSGEYADGAATPEQREQAVATRLAAYRAGTGSRTLRMRDGRFLTALERRSDNGNLVCVRTDTTDLKRAEEHLRRQAERDPLTLLHNRTYFLAALDRALAGIMDGVATDAVAADGVATDGLATGGVLLLLDIDYFKQINDTLGHDMGDALLIEIAARLRRFLRDRGEGSARLGGDEFGVVISGLTDPSAAMARVDGLHAALSAPANLGGRRTAIGISMGTTRFPDDGTDATKLLKNADLALYEAKRTGRARWSAFRPEQAAALERQVRMADALRDALARHRVTVALQPKRRLRDGAHAGFEALARWHDGTNWVPPAEFIPIAEDTGLIRSLGRVVMAAALARIRDIRDQGVAPGRVALNVTGPQLLDPQFQEQTLAALRRHGLGPADLELELTGDSLFGRASERTDAALCELSDLGMTLALDDFGTGYASIAHLSRLPIDRLKIDRSFADGSGRGGADGMLARAVIGLAHSLGMESVAKGVETEEQLAFLAAAGCDVAQGYLISRPLPTTAAAVAYLRTVEARDV
jgi:diguanylate cyclase (GGDEF)-like protein/PAS domain S-box-containing protein